MSLPLLSVPYICDPLAGNSLCCAVEMYPYLGRLDLADVPVEDSHLNIDILIGADNYWRLVTGEVEQRQNCPTAIRTRSGWVLSGPLEGQSTFSTHTVHVSMCTLLADTSFDFESALKQFWDLETLGIKSEDTSLYGSFIETAVFKDGHYEVQLPWQENRAPLPSNYQLSLKRLTGLLARLRRDPLLFQEYNAVIQDQLARGIIEVVSQSDPQYDYSTHYIPHHAVIRRDKETTKLRVVFDASARSNGPFLNDCLYSGPPLSLNII